MSPREVWASARKEVHNQCKGCRHHIVGYSALDEKMNGCKGFTPDNVPQISIGRGRSYAKPELRTIHTRNGRVKAYLQQQIVMPNCPMRDKTTFLNSFAERLGFGS